MNPKILTDPAQLAAADFACVVDAPARPAGPAGREALGARLHARAGRYQLRLALTRQDLEAACRLRFRVFNLELGKGIEASYSTGLDSDPYDAFCEHLLVEDVLEESPSRRIVGTYRMQSGSNAAAHLGYYSEQEFDFAPYEPLRSQVLELGRACIDREHRTPEVLTLLWRGIAQYAADMRLRYLVGCSSINSQRPSDGWELYERLTAYRVSPEFATLPTAAYACPRTRADRARAGDSPLLQKPLVSPEQGQDRSGGQVESHVEAQVENQDEEVKIPRLLKTYLAIGARFAAPPAWDREFGTVDLLTLLDLELLSSAARKRFMAPLHR